MSKTFGINGFGRIGRTTFRAWWENYRDKIDLKLINTSGSMELDNWVHLLKYDTSYGVFNPEITIEKQQSKSEASDENPVLGLIKLKHNSNPDRERVVVVTAQRDPEKIPWQANQVQMVIEATGVFRTTEAASKHLTAGAKHVIISAPPKDDSVCTAVKGINKFDDDASILSNASCTTNCVAPVVQIMHDHFGVEKAMLTTIHAYTDDQNTQDNSHKDMRRARAAAENIIPTTTGAALATTRIITELQGKFDGMAVRVPTLTGSLSDIVFITKKPTSKEEVNKIFTKASQSERWQGILAVTNDPIVSSDIVGRSESSIVDLSLTNVIDETMVKVVSWYDNEWGYCCRLIEQIVEVS